VTKSVAHFGGQLLTVSHWSEAVNGFMTFNIFLPDIDIDKQRGKPYPALYCLGGLESNHESFSIKSGFGSSARKHRIAVIFPDASPRNTNIEGVADDWEVGNSASYYVDATSEKYKKHFQMFTYITQELPKVVSQYFPVSLENKSITGFSMGGHGALVAALRTGSYRSVSAFAPISNPTANERWGQKAYKEYFKNWETEGKAYDATEIIKSSNYHETPLFF
jgi:S-formylglutathione hydrolase